MGSAVTMALNAATGDAIVVLRDTNHQPPRTRVPIISVPTSVFCCFMTPPDKRTRGCIGYGTALLNQLSSRIIGRVGQRRMTLSARRVLEGHNRTPPVHFPPGRCRIRARHG